LSRPVNPHQVSEPLELHTQRLSCFFPSCPARRVSVLRPISPGLLEIGPEICDVLVVLDADKCHAGAGHFYEISRYGTLRTWAQQLGMRDAAKLLDQTLAEEKKTDELLTQLAEARANPKADKAA
jgi:ferritin-like metal-binding protein YciE